MNEFPAINDEITQYLPDSVNKKVITFRIKCIIASLFSISYLIYRLLYEKYTGQLCNIDKYHQITYQANRKLYHGWDNTIIGIGQLLMDGWVIFTGLYWFWNCKNMRFPSAIGVFFIFRALLLNLEKFPFPEDIVWHNPGFIAITVPYDHTRDFFYSGHTGTLTIIALQFYTLNRKLICLTVLISLIYMVNMLTITRIHYSIDIIGALIFAPFWFFTIKKNLQKFDFGFSIFYLIGRKIFQKCKKNEYNQQTSQIQIQNVNQNISNKQNNEKQIKITHQNSSQTSGKVKQIDMNQIFKDQQNQIPYLELINKNQNQYKIFDSIN